MPAFHQMGGVAGERAPRRGAFTLFEMMMAIAVLALVFTAVTVSFRSKWQAEGARRGAQRLALAWLKARSFAWREGREWVIVWNGERAEVHAQAVEDASGAEADGGGQEPGRVDHSFTVALGPAIRLVPERDQDALPPMRFLPNGRVCHLSLLVVGANGDAWRVRTDWDGKPVLEKVAGNAVQGTGRSKMGGQGGGS